MDSPVLLLLVPRMQREGKRALLQLVVNFLLLADKA